MRPFLVLAVVTAVLAGGCAGVSTGERLDAEAVTEALRGHLGTRFEREEPPSGLPGIPSLAGTYTANTAAGRVVVLDFHSAQAVDDDFGRSSLEGFRVLRRENLVILDGRSGGTEQRVPDLRAALNSAPYRD
jgi:hypothetical protein